MMYGRRTTSLSRSWHTRSGVPAPMRRKRLNQREKETSNSCDDRIAARRHGTAASAFRLTGQVTYTGLILVADSMGFRASVTVTLHDRNTHDAVVRWSAAPNCQDELGAGGQLIEVTLDDKRKVV